MKLLSIIVLFCDKDVQYVPRMLANIRDKVLVDYEVILVDNRDENKYELPPGDYKLVTKGKNVYQFEGRRLGLDVAEGKYTWFVDVDDFIVGTLEERDFTNKTTSEVIQMYHEDTVSGTPIFPGTSHCDYDIRPFGVALWNRLIKTSFLRSILRHIKRDIVFMGYEDRFFVRLISDNLRNVKYIDKIVYKYNTGSSTRYGGNFTLDKYNKLEIGIENLEYLASFLKDSDDFINDINSARSYQYYRVV